MFKFLAIIVPVANKPPTVEVPETNAFPWTAKARSGEVVPIPTFPVASMRIRSDPLVEIPKMLAAGLKNPGPPDPIINIGAAAVPTLFVAIEVSVIRRISAEPKTRFNVPSRYKPEFKLVLKAYEGAPALPAGARI